ncbi:hypothetical protein RG963_15710 [Methanosarcina sp. Z-7115]|uniref:Uncharacterized protein n=1 Tax=Methanosarcina baikalica TaxID=3073890 RepID=A0ABU2D5F3_9EURY|nr:hypothetical protein [Methanosarcina sp. Z-7115]MDR7667196.1 hypothetical protein [Methanosarcina sp. Z-7115]
MILMNEDIKLGLIVADKCLTLSCIKRGIIRHDHRFVHFGPESL